MHNELPQMSKSNILAASKGQEFMQGIVGMTFLCLHFSFIYMKGWEAEVRWSLAHSCPEFDLDSSWLVGKNTYPTTCGLSLLLKFTYNGDISWLEASQLKTDFAFKAWPSITSYSIETIHQAQLGRRLDLCFSRSSVNITL